MHEIKYTAKNGKKVIEKGTLEIECVHKIKVFGMAAKLMQEKHPSITELSIDFLNK